MKQEKMQCEPAVDPSVQGKPQTDELREIYMAAPIGLCTLDTDGRYLRINECLAALNGAPAAEHLGRTVREMAPHLADQIERVLHRVVRTGVAVMDEEVTGKTPAKQGGLRHWNTIWLPAKDETGAVVQINVWVVEVTGARCTQRQLERMNRELALAHRWLNGIINGTTDCIAAMDTDQRVIAYNGAAAREFERLFGLTIMPGDRLAETLARFPEERDSALVLMNRALEEESFTVIQDFGGSRNRRTLYEITLSTVRDAEGTQIGTSLIARNVTERVRAEERFRAAAECLSDVIFEWDLRDRITWFGDVDAMMGHPPGGFPRHASGWADTLHPRDRDAVIAAIKQSLEKNAPPVGTFRVRRKDGHYAVWSVRGKVVRNPQGTAQKWVGAVSDVTERRRNEAIMAARMRLMTFSQTHPLRALLQAILDEAEALTESRIGFFHFLLPDQHTLYLQAWSSNTVKSMCTAEGAGQHYPVDQAGVWADCVRERRPIMHNDYPSLPGRRGLPQGHAPVQRELTVPVMRGGLVTAILGVGNKPDEYGEEDVRAVSALADFGWDIAERKRIEEALQESERQYRALVDNTGTGLVIIDETGVVLEANDHYVRMAGARNPEEVVGGSILDWTASDHRAMNEAAVARCARLGHIEDFETVYLGNDHKRRHIMVNAVLHDTAQQKRIVAFCRDITERKLSELRMAEMRTALAARVGELEAATAHIRTLQGIIPICMHCHKIRDDQQSWQQLEQYIQRHSDAHFSHGLCPECAQNYYPECCEERAPDATDAPRPE